MAEKRLRCRREIGVVLEKEYFRRYRFRNLDKGAIGTKNQVERHFQFRKIQPITGQKSVCERCLTEGDHQIQFFIAARTAFCNIFIYHRHHSAATADFVSKLSIQRKSEPKSPFAISSFIWSMRLYLGPSKSSSRSPICLYASYNCSAPSLAFHPVLNSGK